EAAGIIERQTATYSCRIVLPRFESTFRAIHAQRSARRLARGIRPGTADAASILARHALLLPVPLALAAAVAAPRTGDALAGRADQASGDGFPARTDVCRSIGGAGADAFRGARMTAAASVKSPAAVSARGSH